MPPLDLNKVREAAQAFLDRYIQCVDSGDWGFWDPEKEPHVIALRAQLETLTAHLALSDYDGAVMDLAKYLPDGWVCQDRYAERGAKAGIWHFKVKPTTTEIDGGIFGWASPTVPFMVNNHFIVPVCHDWRTSLRLIRNGVVQGGGE